MNQCTKSTATPYYTHTACDTGMYKSATGSGNCTSCPMFSEALSIASTGCTCLKGHRRSNPADVTLDCDRELVFFSVVPHSIVYCEFQSLSRWSGQPKVLSPRLSFWLTVLHCVFMFMYCIA